MRRKRKRAYAMICVPEAVLACPHFGPSKSVSWKNSRVLCWFSKERPLIPFPILDTFTHLQEPQITYVHLSISYQVIQSRR